MNIHETIYAVFVCLDTWLSTVLMVWLCLRQPLFAGRYFTACKAILAMILLPPIITMAGQTVSAMLGQRYPYLYVSWYVFWNAWVGFMFACVLVLLRRIIGLVVIEDSASPRPKSPISIKELFVATFICAAAFAMLRHLDEIIQMVLLTGIVRSDLSATYYVYCGIIQAVTATGMILLMLPAIPISLLARVISALGIFVLSRYLTLWLYKMISTVAFPVDIGTYFVSQFVLGIGVVIGTMLGVRTIHRCDLRFAIAHRSAVTDRSEIDVGD